jgi:hypothetical protein
MLVTLDRVIPEIERKELRARANRCVAPGSYVTVAEQIASQEPDLLLAWALDGASRLVARGDYAISTDGEADLNDWANEADIARAWFAECCSTNRVHPDHWVSCADAYEHFVMWAEARKHRHAMLSKRGFIARIRDIRGVGDKKSGSVRGLKGFTINGTLSDDVNDMLVKNDHSRI